MFAWTDHVLSDAADAADAVHLICRACMDLLLIRMVTLCLQSKKACTTCESHTSCTS